VSSELTTGWWAPTVDQVTGDLPKEPYGEVTEAPPLRIETDPLPADHEVAGQPAIGQIRSGLKARLLAVDVVAAGSTWFVLGTIDMPAESAARKWGAALAALLVTLITMKLLRLYRARQCVQRGQEVVRVLIAVAVGTVALKLVRGDWGNGDRMAIVAAGCCFLALIALRSVFGHWLRSERALGRHQRGLIMIGTNDDAIAVSTMLNTQPELGYEVRGLIGEPRRRAEWEQLCHGRTLQDLPELARKTGASGVLLVANALSATEVREAIEVGTAEGLHVQVWPGFRGLRARRVRWSPMSGETFLYVEPERHPKWQLGAKRVVDVLGAAIGLLITSPVIVLAAIAIRLEDRGPALYRQVRIGLNGRPFEVYKLRTMAPGSDRDADLESINERTDGPLFKAAHDPRITRVGAVVRALSIDELPQLFNVLTGTMSLVGPRPAIPAEVEQFDSELLRRHAVKPGITGLWQLEARDNPSFHAYRRLDLLYVDNWSIGLDLYIILATVPMVVAQILNSYRRERELRRAAAAEAAG
jgi:exopolysaccharide biosynthesis polyprenyl glycosylphosphotransferase